MTNAEKETKNYGLDVAAIERELEALWENIAQADSERSEAVLRACVMNLIAYSDLEWASDQMYDTISEISREHPSRIFLILPAEGAGSRVKAEVTAQCHTLGAPRQHVCCEIIRIATTEDQLKTLPSGIRALLVADLPVVLWWRADLEHSTEMLELFAAEADRIIVNSKSCRARAGDVRKLIRLFRNGGPSPAIGDLNWSRLTHWRNAVAGLFDSPPWNEFLEKIRRVRVRYAGPGTELRLQPILLAGWIASRLGWMPIPGLIEAEKGKYRLQAEVSGEDAHCEFTMLQEGEIDGLLSIELSGGLASSQLFRAERSQDGQHVRSLIVQDGAEQTPRVQLLFQEGEAELLCRELEILSRDASYEESLEFAARWLEPGEKKD